jgi:hypothetical protein
MMAKATCVTGLLTETSHLVIQPTIRPKHTAWFICRSNDLRPRDLIPSWVHIDRHEDGPSFDTSKLLYDLTRGLSLKGINCVSRYAPIVGKGSLGEGSLKSLIITNPYDII